MPRLKLSLMIASAVCAVVFLVPNRARAGIQIWENNADNPELRQYFQIGGFVQPGFVWRQADPTTAKYDPNSDSGFYLQRARVNFQGQLTKYFIMRFELEMMPIPQVQDAYVESDIFQALHIRVGQFLVPFLQSFQYNEMNLSFIDRPIYVPQAYAQQTLNYLSPRDIGLALSGLAGDIDPKSTLPVFEYGIGVFNGQGPSVANNPDRALEITARVQLHILGLPTGREWESDLTRNEKPKLAVAFGGFTNCDSYQSWDKGFTADATFRYQGLYVSGSFVYFNNGPAYKGNALGYDYFCHGGQVPPNIDSGGHIQAQYLLPRQWFGPFGGGLEILARWDQVTPFAAPTGGFLGSTSPSAKGYVAPTNYDDPIDAPARWRFTAGLNWYPIKMQSLKLSVNYQYTNQTQPLAIGDEQIYLAPSLLWVQLTAGI